MGDLDAKPTPPEPALSIGMVLATMRTSQDALEEALLKLRRVGIEGQNPAVVETAREFIGDAARTLRVGAQTVAGLAGKVDR